MPARLSLTLLACASALALAACKDDDAPTAAAYDFANAQPAVIGLSAPTPYDGYALAERAHAFDRATYRAAPSYGFRYGDEEPWAWRTDDDYSMYAEPYDDGYRSYYYEPGADYPYFVRDDDYGYGYGPDGALVAAYDSYGERLPQDRLYALAALAGQYLLRASAIRQYALDDRYRIPVSQDYWSARAPRYYEAQQVWYTAPERQPQWQAWRSSHEREVAPLLPRGEVRRWSKADDKAWKAYEQADRKASKAEDKAWRKAERQQVAVAAPPPLYVPRDVRQDRHERVDDRKAGRRDEVRALEARLEAPRDVGGRGAQGRGRDRVEVATASPRPEHKIENRRAERRESPRDAQQEQGRHGHDARTAKADQPPPQVAQRKEHGGGHEAQVARAEAPQPQAAPPREHGGGGGKHRQEVAAAPAPQQREHGGGKPDRGASPAQADHGQGGGKGHGKDKKD